MFIGISHILKAITTDDDKNVVIGMVRVGWVAGLGVYLFGGLSMIAVMLRIAWSQNTAADYSSFGIGFAAWCGGLSAYIAAGAGALWMQAKADAVPVTTVTHTVENPPMKETVTTEMGDNK